MPNLSAHIQTFSVFDAPYAGHDFTFESIDGLDIDIGELAVIGKEPGYHYFQCGVLPNGYIEAMKWDSFPLYAYTWNKRRQFRAKIGYEIRTDPDGSYVIGSCEITAPQIGIGLIFTGTKVQGFAGNAGAHSTVDLITGLVSGDPYENLFEIIFYPGNGAYFYVDGVLAGSVTTNLPSGTTSAYYVWALQMHPDAPAAPCIFKLSRIQVSQDR